MKNKNIKARINRIIGQLRGIEKMVQEERDCEEILLQISAVKKAIDGLTKEILASSICKLVSDDKKLDVERVISRAVDL